MNALADSINTKAGLSGRKDISELKDAVDGITVGIDTSDATAYNSEILFGKTAYARGTKLTGTILSQPAQTITPTIAAQTIPAGWYLSGTQTIEGVVCTNLIPENIADGVTVKIGTATDDDSVALVVGTHQGGAQPQLNAPTISVTSSGNQSVISITNPTSNGNFVEKYKIFLNGTLWNETTLTSNIPITELGTNLVMVKACGTDFEDSPASNSVTVNNYSITVTCVDCTADAGNPTYVSNNGATATLVFTPDTDLEIRSDSVVISGASVVSVDKTTGTVVIGMATANVVMAVTALEIPSVAILTVSGLGNSDPTTVTFTEEGIFDWNFTEETINGNVFIKIPTMYRKINTITNNRIASFSLSNTKVDNDYQPYPCFLDGDGTTVLPYVLIGKYCSSSTSVMNSVNASVAPQTLENGRTNARALGTGYQLYDWQIQKLFVDLAMMKAKTVNFQDGSARISEYLGISQINSSVWIDGIYHDSTVWYAALNPSNYVSNPSGVPTGYSALSYSTPISNDGEVTALGYDSNNPFVNYPSATALNSSFNTYYCDEYAYSSGNCPVRSCVGAALANFGLWLCDVSNAWSDSYSVRLCYKPISA